MVWSCSKVGRLLGILIYTSFKMCQKNLRFTFIVLSALWFVGCALLQ